MLLFVDKKAILNLRLRPEIRDEFAIAAELRGASMSGLLHQFIVRTIREEKEHSPQSFAKNERQVNETNQREKGKVVAHIGSGRPTKAEVQRMIEQPEIDQLEARLKTNKGRDRIKVPVRGKVS